MRLHHLDPSFADANAWLVQARQRIAHCPAAEGVFEHVGRVTEHTVPSLVERVENNDRVAFDGLLMRKRLVNIAIEALDNIRLYALPAHADRSFAMVASDARGYALAFGNAVEPATAALLVHRLGIINQMDAEDLREHYQRLLDHEGRTREGGAGLGLLTMARRISGPLVASSSPLAPGAAYFTLEVRLDRGQAVAA